MSDRPSRATARPLGQARSRPDAAARPPAPVPEPETESGHERWDAGGVRVVLGPEGAAEIALFERDPDGDVAGGRDGEEQVRRAHQRGGPEGEHQTGHQRVAHDRVQPADLQRRRRVCARSRRGAPPGLPQPNEVKVVDGEGRRDREHPTRRAQQPQGVCRHALDVPDEPVPRLPQRQQEGEADVRGEHVGGALELGRDPTPEPGLHRAAGHDRVLDGEEQQEREVDGDGPAGARASRPVDRAGEEHPGEEDHRPCGDGDEAAPGGGGDGEEHDASGHPLMVSTHDPQHSRGTTALLRGPGDVPRGHLRA